MKDEISQPAGKGIIAVYRSKRHLMLANFLGGLAWGFGSVMGATVLVAVLLILLRLLGGIPLIGAYISEFVHAVSTTTRH